MWLSGGIYICFFYNFANGQEAADAASFLSIYTEEQTVGHIVWLKKKENYENCFVE